MGTSTNGAILTLNDLHDGVPGANNDGQNAENDYKPSSGLEKGRQWKIRWEGKQEREHARRNERDVKGGMVNCAKKKMRACTKKEMFCY